MAGGEEGRPYHKPCHGGTIVGVVLEADLFDVLWGYLQGCLHVRCTCSKDLRPAFKR